jgi:hypothetical protein
VAWTERKGGGEKAGGEGGSIANVKFPGTAGDGACGLNSVVGALDHDSAFVEKNATGFGEANRLRTALEKEKPISSPGRESGG